MLPINEGEEGQGNGNGESYIGLSFSCDGFSWSSLTRLVGSTGLQGAYA